MWTIWAPCSKLPSKGKTVSGQPVVSSAEVTGVPKQGMMFGMPLKYLMPTLLSLDCSHESAFSKGKWCPCNSHQTHWIQVCTVQWHNSVRLILQVLLVGEVQSVAICGIGISPAKVHLSDWNCSTTPVHLDCNTDLVQTMADVSKVDNKRCTCLKFPI